MMITSIIHNLLMAMQIRCLENIRGAKEKFLEAILSIRYLPFTLFLSHQDFKYERTYK